MTLSNINQICVNALLQPTVITPVDRRIFVQPDNNTIGDASYINSTTGDYLFNDNGNVSGLNGVQQQVFLALSTQLGSSAVVNLGQSLTSIRVITNNINSDISNYINLALVKLINSGSILLNNITTNKIGSNSLEIVVDWTDLTTTQIQQLNFGPNAVKPNNYFYDSESTVGISPEQISSIETWYRADRGVVAPNNLVSAWFNESGFIDDGYAFDAGRDLYQGTISKQPILNSSDGYLNFQPSITFANNARLQSGSWFDGYEGNPVTVVCVGYWKNITGTFKMFDGYGISSMYCESNAGTLKIHETADAVGGSINTSANVFIIVFNDSYSYYKQSSNTKVVFTGSPGESNPTGITVGGGLTDGFSGFTMAEFALFDGELSQWYQDALNVFLGNRYAIKIS